MGRTVALSKFVGTISLGLFTGLSYSLTTTTLPSLLALPTATTCSSTLTHLTRISTFHRRILTTLPLVFFPLAYVLSPSYARHPYLLWTTLVTAAAGYGPELVLTWSGQEEDEDAVNVGRAGEEEVNGEAIRRNVESLRRQEGTRAGVAGVAFMMGVVGIWGDGY